MTKLIRNPEKMVIVSIRKKDHEKRSSSHKRRKKEKGINPSTLTMASLKKEIDHIQDELGVEKNLLLKRR